MELISIFSFIAAIGAAVAAFLTYRQSEIANRLSSLSTLDTYLERARFYQDAWLAAYLAKDETQLALKKTDLFNHLEVSALALNSEYYPEAISEFVLDVVLGSISHFEARSDIGDLAESDVYGGLYRNLVSLCKKHRKEINRRKQLLIAAT